jgi:hypothetical protein
VPRETKVLEVSKEKLPILFIVLVKRANQEKYMIMESHPKV